MSLNDLLTKSLQTSIELIPPSSFPHCPYCYSLEGMEQSLSIHLTQTIKQFLSKNELISQQLQQGEWNSFLLRTVVENRIDSQNEQMMRRKSLLEKTLRRWIQSWAIMTARGSNERIERVESPVKSDESICDCGKLEQCAWCYINQPSSSSSFLIPKSLILFPSCGHYCNEDKISEMMNELKAIDMIENQTRLSSLKTCDLSSPQDTLSFPFVHTSLRLLVQTARHQWSLLSTEQQHVKTRRFYWPSLLNLIQSNGGEETSAIIVEDDGSIDDDTLLTRLTQLAERIQFKLTNIDTNGLLDEGSFTLFTEATQVRSLLPCLVVSDGTMMTMMMTEQCPKKSIQRLKQPTLVGFQRHIAAKKKQQINKVNPVEKNRQGRNVKTKDMKSVSTTKRSRVTSLVDHQPSIDSPTTATIRSLSQSVLCPGMRLTKGTLLVVSLSTDSLQAQQVIIQRLNMLIQKTRWPLIVITPNNGQVLSQRLQCPFVPSIRPSPLWYLSSLFLLDHFLVRPEGIKHQPLSALSLQRFNTLGMAKALQEEFSERTGGKKEEDVKEERTFDMRIWMKTGELKER